jgi:hypothetical protein
MSFKYGDRRQNIEVRRQETEEKLVLLNSDSCLLYFYLRVKTITWNVKNLSKSIS